MSLLLYCISEAFVSLLRISTRACCVVALLCAEKLRLVYCLMSVNVQRPTATWWLSGVLPVLGNALLHCGCFWYLGYLLI